ncbi:MAG: pilus assembly protein [Deltaproteobacteria bacterium]|nr:pilus assembly protein [Deltaproteobacteria bacterium]
MRRFFDRVKSPGPERGSAMVEFAVLMLAFVPLVLLPLYFSDALRYKLEAQEAVYMSVWDFAFGDYAQNSASGLAGGIDSKNQELYQNFKAGDTVERQEGDRLGNFADAKWAEQISCSNVNTDFGSDPFKGLGFLSLAGDFHDEYTKGGLVTCTGKISVANYYIPTSFVDDGTDDGGEGELADRRFFNQAQDKGDEGGEGGGEGESAWLDFEQVKMGLLVDPWCIHDTAGTDGECSGNSEFCDRVEFCWKEGTSTITYILWAYAGWLMFGIEMFLDINITTLMYWPDDPTELKMSVKHPPTGQRLGHYVTPMKDGCDDNHEETFNERDDYFLGCKGFSKGAGECD